MARLRTLVTDRLPIFGGGEAAAHLLHLPVPQPDDRASRSGKMAGRGGRSRLRSSWTRTSGRPPRVNGPWRRGCTWAELRRCAAATQRDVLTARWPPVPPGCPCRSLPPFPFFGSERLEAAHGQKIGVSRPAGPQRGLHCTGGVMLVLSRLAPRRQWVVARGQLSQDCAERGG